VHRKKIVEDAEADATARDVIRKIISDVLNALRAPASHDLGNPRPGLPVVSVDLQGASEHPVLQGVKLWLAPEAMAPGQTRGRFVWSPSGRRIELFVKPPAGLPPVPSPEQWDAAVRRHGSKMVTASQEHLRHELVHLLDAARMDSSSIISTFGKERKKKGTRSPAELNAYFQQALSRVEDFVQKSRSRGEFKLRSGGSAVGLYKKVVMELPGHFVSSMDDDAKRRLQKRTAAMYDRLASRLNNQ